MIKPDASLTFTSGHQMKNRFMLAPMTNQQSEEDGTLSDDELHWLSMRAKGQFGITMTCAVHVQADGKGFAGQLGLFDDRHIEGHRRLAAEIRSYGSISVVQLHHAGMRSPHHMIKGKPLCPSDNEETGARALTLTEVEQLRDDFIKAAVRAKRAGYDGVELHGAHGYIICQFISSEHNLRTDKYGGPLENRTRLLFEIVEGVRARCGEDFLLGVRLSPERAGMKVLEIQQVCRNLIATGKIDFLDISLWDCFKEPYEEDLQGRSLLSYFSEIDFGPVKWTVAGKIDSGKKVQEILDQGVDFVSIGKSAILHHNFPQLVIDNPAFETKETPVTKQYLRDEGLGEKFVNYMSRWNGFVEEASL